MALQGGVFLACFEVPKFGSLVHRPSRTQTLVRVEGNSNDFVLVASEGMQQFAGIRIPQLRSGIEAASYDFVPA